MQIIATKRPRKQTSSQRNFMHRNSYVEYGWFHIKKREYRRFPPYKKTKHSRKKRKNQTNPNK